MKTDPRILYIGKRIRELRAIKGLTQKELTEKCNRPISRTTITSYEVGMNKNPTITNLYAIADALEIPITKLLMEENNELPISDNNSIANAYKE